MQSQNNTQSQGPAISAEQSHAQSPLKQLQHKHKHRFELEQCLEDVEVGLDNEMDCDHECNGAPLTKLSVGL